MAAYERSKSMTGAGSSWKLGEVSINSAEHRNPQFSRNSFNAFLNSRYCSSSSICVSASCGVDLATSCRRGSLLLWKRAREDALKNAVAHHRACVGQGGVLPTVAADVDEPAEVLEQLGGIFVTQLDRVCASGEPVCGALELDDT